MLKRVSLISLGLLLIQAVISAETIEITIPKVPEVPKVEAEVPTIKLIRDGKVESNSAPVQKIEDEKKVQFSDHVAPTPTPKKSLKKVAKNKKEIKSDVGEIKRGRVSAYLQAPLMSSSDISKALEGAGFKVLSIYSVDAMATSIIFTNQALIKAASKPERGFAAALRITLDKKDKTTTISNPIFMLKAFLQEDYDATLAKETLKNLKSLFKDLKESKEIIKFSALEHFQFMMGMPKYEDMQVIKKASNEALLKKLRASKKVVFEQKLQNGSYLVAVKLSKETRGFISKIGYKNAALLPYPLLIENGEAKILDPKYYIAVMYPLLEMSQFMTIAAVPDAITKDIDRLFR